MITLPILKFLLVGCLLGLTAGISPGPLLALVISQSLKYGSREGVKVAFAPLIADIPIILLTVFLLSKLSGFDVVLSLISFAGGIFAAFLGFESFKTKGLLAATDETKANSVKRGIIAGILNPHPYLFWATIGTPYLLKASELSVLAVIFFIGSFYACLVGSKMVIAIITGHSKKLINNKAYILIMKILGVVLFALSMMFFYDGVNYLLN